jgi:alanyl-tRNA synthetase
MLKVQPDQLVGRIEDMVERLRTVEKELEKVRVAQLLASAGSLAAGAKDINGVKVIAHRLDGAGGNDVRTLVTDVRGRFAPGEAVVVVGIGVADGKVSVVAATSEAARDKGLSANDLLRAVSPLVGGKGGGKPDMAQGGGTDATQVDAALALVESEVARTVAP